MPAVTSSSFTSAQPLGVPFTQFKPPIVQQPKLISETLMSVLPIGRYFMLTNVAGMLRFGNASGSMMLFFVVRCGLLFADEEDAVLAALFRAEHQLAIGGFDESSGVLRVPWE